MQEGPVRAVASPSPPTAAALARLRALAFTPTPLALPRPFASAWLRLRTGRSRGAARRVARPPPPQGAPHPRKARRIPPLPHLRPPRAIASNTPRPNAPSCPRARDFWPPNRVLARIGPDPTAHRLCRFRRPGLSPGRSALFGRRGAFGVPELGFVARNRMFSRTEGGRRPAQPERRAAAQPARAGGGAAGARGGHAGGAAGRGGHAADARGGTEKPTSSPSRPKSLGDTSSLLRFRPHDCYTPSLVPNSRKLQRLI